MKTSCLAVLFLILTSWNILHAQDYTFYHYGLDDGLSQETVRSILKDENGFLWLGTQDGLNRFDGTSFKVYKNQKKDSLSISGNFINTLVEDNNNNIWIGTNDNGICIYDSNLNSFKKTIIKKGNCTSLSKMSNGSIIATILNQGIVVFEKKNDNYHPFIITKANNEQLQFNTSFINHDSLFVSTNEGRVFVIRNILDDNRVFDEIKLGNSVGVINTIFIKDDTLWLGTSNGLFAFNQKTKSLNKIELESNEKSEKLNIESINFYNNVFYLGTFNGLFIAKNFNDLKFETITTYKGEQKHSNSISSNRVYDTFTDGNLLWIGTNNLDVVPLKKPVFKTINTNSEIALNNSFILSFAKNDEYLFVGTRKGINCINSKDEVTQITKENTNNTFAFNVIRAMAIDQDNNLWVATIKGVSIIDLKNFNPKKPNIISIYHDETNLSSLSSNATRGVYIDHNNNVWIATYGGGINRFTGNLKEDTLTFENYKSDIQSNSISSDFTYNISQDKDLNYWITSEDGLNKLTFETSNYSQPKFTNYYHDINDANSISSNTTLHTWHDENQILWIATQDGFNKFDPKKNTFKRYDEENGLTNTFVYSITEDKSHNLWLTTNGGLFKFDKNSEKFTNYNQRDGVQSSEFNLGAHYYDKDSNQVYVGGISGFNIFDPNKVSELDVEGNITFTSLRVKDKEISPSTHPSILNESITKTDEITLHDRDFPCYISFSDLDLRPNKNNQFIYALNDNEWNDLRDTREIQLLELPKGNHVLQIQGKSRNKVWSTSPLQLKIKVIPPWYKSNFMYCLYILAFLALVYIFYRLSLQKQIANQESKRLQELDNLKSRFITNITHEFRTPLTIILGYLDNLKERFSSKDDVNSSLNTIEQSSNSLLNLVNQMLDLAKLEKGQLNLNLIQNDIVAYSKHIVDSFLSIAPDKKIELKFSANPDKILMDYDAEKWRQILSNLISNALKFSSKDSELKIDITKIEKNTLRVKVIDQGHGISEEELPYIFDRFFQVENNEHKIAQGTGIGLALIKELVELFKGSINVKSKLNIGTTFTVTLPITNNAEEKVLDLSDKTVTIDKVVPQLNDILVDKDSNTVLIVEDNTDMAHYIASCLQPHYKVSFAKNGKEGLELAKANIPDIVITDVMMPIMDGYELTQKLQGNTNTNHIPIIMLTSKAMQEDKIEGITSGADAYLTKPFQKEELILRMQMLIAKRKKLQEIYSVHTIVEKTELKKVTTDKNLIFLNKAIEAIHKHLDNSNFGAIQLARFMLMSDSQLYRKLKAISNTSTAIFIRKVRLEKAKELLKTTDLSISEIAYNTGFNDPNWFSKAFKEEFDQSPTEFRN
ncbi:hybrid sensor histidine kinase/response regulator transcription factor [Psychroserpens luteus]|uniref:histidine kinase n=1 Tax=Psychroserpens luteus TaxID=1434066 RepID=A0ABW5ZRK3_9FLAO|nr:hybrid sensor histidine kinase/response regulator transcription factor [Psychroserpens luteus]